MEDRVIEGWVRGMTVRFPTAIGQVEFDGAADGVAAVEPDDGIGKIRTGLAVPGSELDDLNFVAGDGTKLATEIAGEPARLQFQFAGRALCGKECAFVDAGGIAKF